MNKVFKIAAAVCAVAVIASTGVAFAAEGEEELYYPTNFEYSLEAKLSDGVSDYAVSGNNYAFAAGENGSYNTIYLLTDGSDDDRVMYSYHSERSITALDYADEVLYFENADGQFSLTFSGGTGTATEVSGHTFLTDDKKWLQVSTTTYLLGKDGVLLNYSNADSTTVEGTYTPYTLKDFDGVVYVLRSVNILCKLDGATAEAVDMSYTDFSATETIKKTPAALNEGTDATTLTTATLKGGDNVYYTQIDANAAGEYFGVIKTLKVSGDTEIADCVILSEFGNAAVIATPKGCFITASANLTNRSQIPLDTEAWATQNNTDGAYAVETTGIYASPCVGADMLIKSLPAGSENAVTVLGKISSEYTGKEFYKVSYTDGDETVYGYVLSAYLTPYSFAWEDVTDNVGGDASFTYKNNVLTVTLAVVIVAIVLVAILYVALVGARKGKNKKAAPPADEDLSEE